MPISYNPKETWPPAAWVAKYRKFDEWAAWYSGDAQALANFYTAELVQFWGRQLATGERRVAVHVPIAGDIASTSANLIFGEKPKIKIPGANEANADSEAKLTQARLDKIMQVGNYFSRLLEAAEVASPFGGVFPKIDWDLNLADYPFLSIVLANAALPEFSYGILTAVTFWREVERDDKHVWRHLERHELDNTLDSQGKPKGTGVILNALYQGDADVLGNPVPLNQLPQTAGLLPLIDTGIKGLVCRYIPNMRPSRLWPGTYLGQSDFSGSEGLMDSLDEVMSDWIRDIRLAKGRIIGSEAFFQSDGAGNITFDVDREAYASLNRPMGNAGLKDELVLSQFAIRAAEHQQTAVQLIINIVTNAGYSPQTFGLEISGQAESGTALDIRRDKSYKTTAKKGEGWKTPLEDLLEIALQVDKIHLGGKAAPLRPTVEMQDGSTPDISQTAQTILVLDQAAAISTELKVEMQHPDWDEQQKAEEVARIIEQRSINVPDPTLQPFSQGDGTAGEGQTGKDEGGRMKDESKSGL